MLRGSTGGVTFKGDKKLDKTRQRNFLGENFKLFEKNALTNSSAVKYSR
jgi:hypothetical protein